jgi:hypothetical protein
VERAGALPARSAPPLRRRVVAEREGESHAPQQARSCRLFDRNPIGVEYDPDELVKKFRSGVPVAELVAPD